MKFSIAVSVPLSLASMVHGAAVEMNARNLTALAAPFAVNIGADTSADNMLAWVSGQNRCTSAVIIGPVGANFCGRPFVLNGISLTAEGCGGPFGLVKTGQSAVFAACTDFNETDECGIHTEWHCV
ncbi:hypothetical protein B0H14DRAFT_3601087 [Mycena olivaceomarginata]|nr:hypothetical protein B0H14DRAFT_2980004 [Mycena olivaceomarginata]KAJ7753145.1 hypothetical protein B0H14DRAFT_3601087 [Mycena olivaceomarginata]